VWLGAVALAARALIVAGHLNLDRRALDRILERNRQVVANVLASRLGARTPSTAATEQIAEPERAEYVLKIRERAGIDAA